MNINGLEVVNTQIINDVTIWGILAMLFTVFMLIFSLSAVFNYLDFESLPNKIIALVSLVITVFSIVVTILICIGTPITVSCGLTKNINEYTCIVNDDGLKSSEVVELMNDYEIVETAGPVWTIREKEK